MGYNVCTFTFDVTIGKATVIHKMTTVTVLSQRYDVASRLLIKICWIPARWNHQSFLSLYFCAWNPPVTDRFPAKRASNAESGSKSWRHYGDHAKCPYLVSSLSTREWITGLRREKSVCLLLDASWYNKRNNNPSFSCTITSCHILPGCFMNYE